MRYLVKIVSFMICRVQCKYASKMCLMLICQEDLMPDDIGPIIDELKAGKKPTPGPRFVFILLNFDCWYG